MPVLSSVLTAEEAVAGTRFDHWLVVRQEIPTAARRRGSSTSHENEVGALLKHEDDLHFDLRRLSFRPAKPPDALKSYAANGSGTVQGVKDAVDRGERLSAAKRLDRVLQRLHAGEP